MSIHTRLFRTADRIADLFGVLRGPFAAADLVEHGLRSAESGRSGRFDATPLLPALQAFLSALDHEAGLSVIGRAAAQWDVRRLIGNAARLWHAEQDDPSILAEPIARPVFILGLPRSGTSFLHSLLGEDPGNAVPRCWQTIYPYPVPEAQTAQARADRVDRQLRSFQRMAPELRSVHPLTAQSGQECTEITAHSFASLRFDSTYRIPSYRRWLDGNGHHAAYAFHRRFLQHLQHQDAQAPPRRWMLKAPDHVFALDALRTAYPDARLVFVHRDPLKVLPSCAKLTEILRTPFARSVDRLEIGQQVCRHWAQGAQNMIAAADHDPDILHVQYRSLIADPMGCIAGLYAQLGMTLEPEAASRMLAMIAAKPDGGYGRNQYHFADHGIAPAAEAERFANYRQRFAVPGETEFTRAPLP